MALDLAGTFRALSDLALADAGAGVAPGAEAAEGGALVPPGSSAVSRMRSTVQHRSPGSWLGSHRNPLTVPRHDAPSPTPGASRRIVTDVSFG